MKILLFVIIILFIFIIPLPLKTIIYCSKENYYIKLFNFKIKYKKQNKVEDTPNKQTFEHINVNNKKENRKNELFQNFSIYKVLKSINRMHFKPWIFIRGTMKYSLCDSANTAILYGIISSLLPITYKMLRIFINTKKFDISITPQFNDNFNYEIKIKSILFVSIGQIINVCYLILYTIIMEKVKEYE